MADTPDTTSIADFEKSLAEPEGLVRDLEQGALSLAQSLGAFERGVRLTRECQQALRPAAQRVPQPGEPDGRGGGGARPPAGGRPWGRGRGRRRAEPALLRRRGRG